MVFSLLSDVGSWCAPLGQDHMVVRVRRVFRRLIVFRLSGDVCSSYVDVKWAIELFIGFVFTIASTLWGFVYLQQRIHDMNKIDKK